MNEDKSNMNEGQEESFAELLAGSSAPVRLVPGEKVEAKIVKITPDWTFIDINAKGEGCLPSKELTDKDGNFFVKEGDIIRAYFLRTEEGEMRFTTQIGSGPAARNMLGDAMREHILIEGTVSKEIKGGFDITLTGGARAFCPFSHMGLRRDEKKSDYVGLTLNFYVLEMKGRSATLTRREIVEAEQMKKAEALKDTLQLGDKISGVVTSIQKFGAFVDIGGVEGLLPISELAWERVENVGDILKKGQQVEVIIKKIDWENSKFSLSLKDTLPDPWDKAEEIFQPGSFHKGKVSRIVPFGAFISLMPGVDGLIHISSLSRDHKVKSPEEVLKVGQEVEVCIERMDRLNNRLSLSLAQFKKEESEKEETIERYTDSGKEERFGTNLGEMLKRKLEEEK